MIKNFISIIIILSAFIFIGCPEINNPSFSSDPDPVDGSTVLPSPAEALYIVANVDGTIYGVNSNDPENYTTIATNASTEEHFSEIRLSPDKNQLLYAKFSGSQTNLVLLNIAAGTTVIVAEDIASNESEFIDNTGLYYTYHGSILYYDIANGTSSSLIPHQAKGRCNHWSKISPNAERIVFKDQIYTEDNEAVHSWSPVVLGQESTECHDITSYDGTINPVDLYDSFYYNWKDNDTVIFKREPGLGSWLYEKNIGINSYSKSAKLVSGDTDVLFEKLLVSPDRTKLLVYGNHGVYLIDLDKQVLSGDITPNELYLSKYTTKFASFGTASQSFVVGTSNWMGIYNTKGMQKTNSSIENVIGDMGTLYALYCR